MEGEKGEGGEEKITAAAGSHWCWSRISPSHLDHRQRLPTAITLHRLVPRPSPSTHQAAATTSTFKYIKPEEVKAAQIKARQEILASRLVSPPATSDTSAPSSSQNKKHHHRKDGSGSQALFPCRLGNGEVGMRRRQLTRLVSQISRTLVDLQDLGEPRQRDFVAPLELEIKRRRWNECARLMRRSLFVLRQEVVALERESGQGTRTSQHLRALAAAARTINIQLMTLKSQAESSCGDLAWTEVLEEFFGVARRMLVLAARVGVQSPPSSVKWATLPQERVAAGIEDTSGQESTITISDVDSTNIHLLQSGYVRDRLAQLATLHLKRRKKQKSQNSTMTEKRQSKQYIVLEPLGKQLDKGKTSLDTTATHQSPASPSYLKEDDGNTSGVVLAPMNTSHSDLHSLPSVCKTSAGIQSHDSYSRTNSASAPQLQTSQTQTSNVPVPQPQLPPHQSDLPASKTYTDMLPHASLSAQNLTEQLSFLLQRVCKLEDNRRKTEALIAEVSQVTHTPDVTQSLGDAVQRARLILTTVRGAVPHPQPLVPNRITGIDSLPKNTGLSIKIPDGAPPRTSPDAAGASLCSEEVEKDVNPLEGKWLTGESVIEQVRRQKEQFWFSLAEQGFVRPPETLSLTGEKCNNDQSVSSKEPYKTTAEEKLEKTSPKKAAAKIHLHQQTQTKSPEQCQSSNKSDSTSDLSSYAPANNKTQHCPSDSKIKSDVSSADARQSFSIQSQLQQNVPAENTPSGVPSSTETESQSFPSYEGVTSLHE